MELRGSQVDKDMSFTQLFWEEQLGQYTSSCKGVDTHTLGASNFSSRNLSVASANLHVVRILITAFLL